MSVVSFALAGLVNYLGLVVAIGAATAALTLVVCVVARSAQRPLPPPAVIYLPLVIASAAAIARRLDAVRLVAPLYDVTAAVQGLWWLDALLVGLPAGLVAAWIVRRLRW